MKPAEETRPVDQLLRPFYRFTRIAASGGILLLLCTVIALAWANSPWHESYHSFWHTEIRIELGDFVLSRSLTHWVNEGLMAVFFFLVGLEIKRELIAGELASPRKAAIPIAAAAGGMIAPAIIYSAFNLGTDAMRGWAIPAATDIAFSLGAMALLGSRVPISLKVFLTALAIVDDIGAVLIIAIFYTEELSLVALGIGGGLFALLVVLNLLHVRHPIAYLVLGIGMWAAFLESGIHATIAGVAAAFVIPAKYRIDGAEFVRFGRMAIDRFEQAGGNVPDVMTNPERESWVRGVEQACEDIQTPLQRIEHDLHPWVSLFIIPVFALANAGVSLGAELGEALSSRICLGVAAGLFIGKQIGIMLATWLAVRLGLGALPQGTNWRQIYATSCLAGIGFTMSLFIANLAFTDPTALEHAKVGILAGSLVSGVAGYTILRMATKRPVQAGSASSSS